MAVMAAMDIPVTCRRPWHTGRHTMSLAVGSGTCAASCIELHPIWTQCSMLLSLVQIVSLSVMSYYQLITSYKKLIIGSRKLVSQP